MIDYGFVKELDLPFGDVLERTTEALKREGFSVLTSIDVQQKLKEKLGVDFESYTILGACNPAFAYEAIRAEKNIGLMLPCNVLIYQKGAKTIVAVMKPTALMKTIINEKLKKIAQTVEARLKSAFDFV